MFVRATSIVFALFVLTTTGTAAAGERPYRDKVSGALADGSTAIDLNGDGVTAGYATIRGRSNYGPVHGWFVLELDVANPGLCTDGAVAFPVVNGTGIRRIPSGELIYLQDSSGTICVDPISGSSRSETEGNFVGGTGRFRDAGGTYKTAGSGQILLSDGVASFFAFTFGVVGVIETP